MRAGTLRHRVAIETQTDTTDSMGGFTTTWAPYRGMERTPAAIWPIRSKEMINSGKLELEVTHRIRIRYRPGITSKMRINWADRSRVFNIISIINPDERNIMLEMLVTEDA